MLPIKKISTEMMIAMIKKPSTKEFWVLDKDLKQSLVNEKVSILIRSIYKFAVNLAVLWFAGHAANCDILRAEANPVIRSGRFVKFQNCQISALIWFQVRSRESH